MGFRGVIECMMYISQDMRCPAIPCQGIATASSLLLVKGLFRGRKRELNNAFFSILVCGIRTKIRTEVQRK